MGPGASWYVRSKLSGAYELYSDTFKKYSRPITTPVHNLRAAQETCEECHWPEKFFGAQLKTITHYGYDERAGITGRAIARKRVHDALLAGLGPEQLAALDELLTLDPETGFTRLTKLRTATGERWTVSIVITGQRMFICRRILPSIKVSWLPDWILRCLI